MSGFGGLAAIRENEVLLANDNNPAGIVRFDMKAEKGTPIRVPLTPSRDLSGSDAIYLPPKYNGTVLLVSIDVAGIEVLRRKDKKWETAEYLGLVSNNVSEAAGGFVTAPVQIGSNLYALEEFFTDRPVPGSPAGNRTQFPLVDITAKVEALLKK